MSLKNEAVEHEVIPAFFLAVARHVITPYLLILIQFSFDHGIFPNDFEIARVVSIYKSGDREDPTNYCLIPILTCFSEIFDKFIYVRLNKFFRKHQIIQPNQYGFQKKKKISTAHVMLDVVTAAYYNIHKSVCTGQD